MITIKKKYFIGNKQELYNTLTLHSRHFNVNNLYSMDVAIFNLRFFPKRNIYRPSLQINAYLKYAEKHWCIKTVLDYFLRIAYLTWTNWSTLNGFLMWWWIKCIIGIELSLHEISDSKEMV